MCSAGVVLESKVICCVLCGASSTWRSKTMFSMLPSSTSRHRLVADVLHRGLHGDVGGVGARQRQVGGDQRVLDQHRAGGREKYLLPDAGVAVADGGDPVPADGGEKGGAVDGRDRRRSCRRRCAACARAGSPGWGCGATSTATTACLPGLTCAVMSKMPRMNAPRIVPTCTPFTQTAAE